MCSCSMYSREVINMFLVGQVSGLVENFNIGIFSDTINVINIKLSMMVLHIEFYLQCQTILTENVIFLSD